MAPKNKIPSRLREFMDLDNLVPILDSEELVKIGSNVVEGAKRDEESRYEWRQQIDEALKIAKQISDGKSSPWPNAADVKFPLLTTANIHFNARSLPEIVQGDKVVNVAVMIPDPKGVEDDRADRLSKHMSYQLLNKSKNWMGDTDKLLMTLPMVGVVYRKSYYDPIDREPKFDFCSYREIIINNYISSLEDAPRVTHVLYMSSNDLVERMRAGIYEKYSLDELNPSEEDDEGLIAQDESSEREYDQADKHEIYEQHTWLDLDDDDYKEPYIIVVHKKTQKVLRIVPRYDEDSFVYNDKTGNFVKIEAIQYFTDYHFIPSPDGTFHSLGYGSLLYPINETVNTLVNQLLDAGTLANRQGGFIGKSLRIRKEDMRFKPGEWKMINVPSGANIGQNIFPLPIKEPSSALFNLLTFMVEAGRDLSSVTEIMQGGMPPPNMPATTVMAMLKQGQKVYSAILHRLYQSFKKEFQKLYLLNKKYLDLYEDFQYATQSGMISLEDYQAPEYGIFPVLDPSMSSDAIRISKAQALMQIISAPGVNGREVIKRYLKALQIEDIEKVLPPPDPNAPPPPQMLLAEAELKHKNMQTADIMMRRELEAMRLEEEGLQRQAQAAYWGGQVTSDKINSIANLAKTEAMVGTHEVEQAEKQAAALGPQVSFEAPADINTRLKGLEQMMSQIMGIQPQQTQQPLGEQQSVPAVASSSSDAGPSEQDAGPQEQQGPEGPAGQDAGTSEQGPASPEELPTT